MTAVPTVLLVHGSWHDGNCWSAVAQRLRRVGVSCLTPTLAGHRAGDNRDGVTHYDYVRSVVAALDATSDPVALVGHSFGGSVISRVAEERPDRCHRLIYYSAFVPCDGERVADSLPESMLAFLDETAAGSPDRSVVLPPELFRTAFANTVDRAVADALYQELVPEPYGPIFEPLALPRFHLLNIPTAYITCRQDLALPPGSFHPGQSSRLGTTRLIEIDGDHEALFTAPDRLTWALLKALDLDACHSEHMEFETARSPGWAH